MNKRIISLFLVFIFLASFNAVTVLGYNDSQPYKERSEFFLNPNLDVKYSKSTSIFKALSPSYWKYRSQKNSAASFFSKNPRIKAIVDDELRKNPELTFIGAVQETLYVKEVVDVEQNIKKSKLLTEKEVKSKESLFTIKSSARGPGTLADTYKNLRQTFTVFRGGNGSSDAEYYLVGVAEWIEDDQLSWAYLPFKGADFMGFIWGGEFDWYDPSLKINYNGNNNHEDKYSQKSTPNAAYIWGFEDYPLGSKMEDGRCSVWIEKNSSTGNGNTTSFSFSYIHTYQKHVFTPTVDKASLAFTMYEVDKSWENHVSISGFEY